MHTSPKSVNLHCLKLAHLYWVTEYYPMDHERNHSVLKGKNLLTSQDKTTRDTLGFDCERSRHHSNANLMQTFGSYNVFGECVAL